MKSVIAKTAVFIVAGFVVLSAATPSKTEMRANIPFAFLAGDRMHPAGEYWVQVNSDCRYVSLRPFNSTTARHVALDGNFVPRTGRDIRGFLRFEQYGPTYALRAVGIRGAESGLGVRPSKAEKELARANGGAPGTEVSLVQ
jgi:hypothetical protein